MLTMPRSTGNIRYFVFVLLLHVTVSRRKNIISCQPGTTCIPVLSCPKMIQLIHSGNPGVTLVQESICGFREKNSMVCCNTTKERTPRTHVPEIAGNQLPELCGGPSVVDKILNGGPTEAKIGAYPWIVVMSYSQQGVNGLQFKCTGSIINSKYVLTSAHCVHPSTLGGSKLTAIHLGDLDLSTDRDCEPSLFGPQCFAPHIVAGPEEVIMHPQYDQRGKASDDIALIRLNVTLDFEREPNIQAICLPSESFDIRSFVDGREPTAAGWGLIERESNILMGVNVPLVDDQDCKDLYKEDFVGNQLCAGGVRKGDTCIVDGGGPLMISQPQGPPFTLLGIHSFGVFPCGLEGFPSVYTSVADNRDWIMQNLRA